ncbi:hypothetical protein SprV_0501890900 [Sparganum proliferum]
MTKAIDDAEGSTDNRFVISKMGLRLQPCKRPPNKADYELPNTATAPLFNSDGTTRLMKRLGRVLQKRPQPPIDNLGRHHQPTPSDGNEQRPGSSASTPRSNPSREPTLQRESTGIGREIYKHGGPQLTDHLTALFQEKWPREQFPQDIKDAKIVHLYKRNDN